MIKNPTHLLLFSLLSFLFCVGGLPISTLEANPTLEAGARDYNREITAQEKEDITYTITTLTGNVFYLGMKKSELNKRGKRTGSVHPLSYFLYVLKDEELSADFHQMNDTAWKRFRKDFAASFSKEKQRNNMHEEIVKDFCSQLELGEQRREEIHRCVENDRWLELMDELKAIAPEPHTKHD